MITHASSRTLVLARHRVQALEEQRPDGVVIQQRQALEAREHGRP